MQLFDFQKYKLLKMLYEETEKTARFIELMELAAHLDDHTQQTRIDRAILRYYALQRRIELIEYKQKAAK